MGVKDPSDKSKSMIRSFVLADFITLVTAEALSGGTGKVKYYEGTPIPASIIIVIILGVAFWQGRIDHLLPFGSIRIGPWIFHPFALLYAASGSAMISAIRIPKP